MRSYQDWYLRYALQSLPGVAEVAPAGGFVREYQVNVDPIRLQAYKLPANAVADAISKSNNDVGARLVEFSGREYMVRGRGYLRSLDDIGNIVLLTSPESGTPVRVRDVATITYGPALRRGVTDLDGRGEAVGGVVIMRVGENAGKVIERVKAQIALVGPSLPKGLRIVPVYDRSELIERAVHNLRHTLVEELIIVSLVILIFLWHFPSAAIPIITIPVTILIAFIPLQLSGMTANIMSLGGIAVAIGAMVDAAIVVVEQTHKKLEHWEAGGRKEDYRRVVIDAVKEVGGPSFFALLVIAVSFLPVFALEAQEGRLFKPLALTKTLAMVIAALLAITLDPAMRLLFTRVKDFSFRPRWLARVTSALLVGKIRSEEEHPISRPLMKLYQPVVEFSLDHKWVPITVALLLMAVTVPVYNRLGSEFMPPLDEGTLLYMPTTLPGISVGEASLLLREQDRILHSFPQVQSVFGKAGRVESATDPAPLSMMETVVVLKPREQWPERERWYTHRLPHWTHAALAHVWPDRQDDQRTDLRRGRNERSPHHAGRDQRVDHADQGTHRHAHHRHAHPARSQGARLQSGRDRAPRPRGGAGAARRSGNRQRLRRAHHRRIFSRFHFQARCSGALRPYRGRCRVRADDRRRRADRNHHGRGARTLRGKRALPARIPQRPAIAGAHSGADSRRRTGASGRVGNALHALRARNDSR